MGTPDLVLDGNGALLRHGVALKIPGVRLEALIGSGANGQIFRARDTLLDRDVAVKIWTKSTGSPSSRSLHEARKLANIDHHSFVPVYSYETYDGTAVAVMRLVNGKSLSEWMHDSTNHCARVTIWTQISSALRFLYAQDLLHGDPHTGNIMVTDSPEGFSAPSLNGSAVPLSTMHRVLILDTGTSRFWNEKANFIAREKKVLVETIDRLLASHLLRTRVDLKSSLSLQDILDVGDGMAIMFAAVSAGPPQGSENMENFDWEMANARKKLPGDVFSAAYSSRIFEETPLRERSPLPSAPKLRLAKRRGAAKGPATAPPSRRTTA